MNRFWLAVLLIMVSLAPLYAESGEEAATIKEQTMSADIQTSSYHELAAWCKRLGLSGQGSAADLRNRLYSYYRVSTPGTAETSSGLKKITIEKAENLDYFTIEKIDENYAEITGDVYLTIEDSEKNEKHVIRADSIIFNFKENFITASGNIVYRLEGETKTENFQGDKITFNIDNSSGLFDKGVTEQKKTSTDAESGKETEITFYFKGELINKTEENYVVLDTGEVTSCDLSEPHFRIRARKIWLLADSEWAILDGTMYMGRIPMLYFPAFLYAGDEMFFNPVFGYNSEYGNYIQTTTYLLGQKEKDTNSPFSFMQSEKEDKYYRLNGLYLTVDDTPGSSRRDWQDYGRLPDNYIKLMLDYYTYLGFFTALDLKLNPPAGGKTDEKQDMLASLVTVIKKIELYVSAAFATKYETVSYPVYSGNADNPTGSYTHTATMFPDENGVYGNVWKKSYFLNNRLPFRYGIDFYSGINLGWMNLNTDFNLFSDSAYKTDYNGRKENLDLLSFMNPDDTAADDSTAITSYIWKAELGINPDMSAVRPYLSAFSVKADSQLTWKPADIDTSQEGFEDSVGDYFYPDNYYLPRLSATVKGSILPLKEVQPDTESSESKEGMKGLRPPWEDFEDRPEGQTEPDLPDARPDIGIVVENQWTADDYFSNSLSYSITPDYNEYTALNSTEWTNPLEIDFTDISYSYRTAGINAAIDYSSSVLKSLFTVTNKIKFDADYQQHYNMDTLSTDTSEKYLEEDNHKTNMTIGNSLTLNASPLIFLDYVNGTRLTYNLNTTLFEYDYSDEEGSFVNRYFEPTADYITAHKLALELPFKAWNFDQTFKVSTSLPPLSLVADGSWLVKFWISSSDFNTSIKETDDNIEFLPLTYNQSFKFSDESSVSNSLSYNYTDNFFEKDILSLNAAVPDTGLKAVSKLIYDFENNVFDEFTMKINYYDLYASFAAENTYDYTFIADTGWRQVDEQAFIPSSFTAGIDSEITDLVLWKNRVKIDMKVNTSLNMKLIQFTESALNFNLSFDIDIYKFLNLHFKTESENKSVYRYFPEYCAEVGVNPINPAADMIKSFNFFNIDDRYESNFNLKKIVIGLTHDLHDWTLNLDYTGETYLNSDGAAPVYDWRNKLDIYLQWNAISDIKTEIKIDMEDISF